MFQPCPRVPEAKTHSARACGANAIPDGDLQGALCPPGADLNPSPLATACNAVDDGILHKRLKDQLRNEHLASIGLHLPTNPKPVFQSHLLQLKIALDELQFVSQSNEIEAAIFKRCAQQS